MLLEPHIPGQTAPDHYFYVCEFSRRWQDLMQEYIDLKIHYFQRLLLIIILVRITSWLIVKPAFHTQNKSQLHTSGKAGGLIL